MKKTSIIIADEKVYRFRELFRLTFLKSVIKMSVGTSMILSVTVVIALMVNCVLILIWS